MAAALSDAQVEKAYRLFKKYADVSTPKEAADDLEAAGMDPAVVEAVRVKHEAETIRIRNLDQPPSVWRDGRVTWYTGPKDTDRNWPAIVRSMQQKNFGDANIASVDEASTKILSLLDHPKQNEFRTRGLVVGFVQSGKTTNFTAVMAKAADRGYKLFIVLSGIHNTLRRQTQLRLGADLVVPNQAQWYEITTPQKDFAPPGGNAKAYFASRGQTMLLVVKKNAAVLRKLRDWLDSADEYLTNVPTLIIDDEADQSTVATAKINPLLHDVMSKFPKVGYIGYTATPFANLLIDPAAEEDFYPRDFVVNLPQPTGYHGTEVLFGRELLPGEDPEELDGGFDMIRTVPDDEVDELKPRTKKEAADFAPGMTHSLRRAVEWFWLATAARKVRGGGNPHSTMLVHTTTDTTVHERFKAPLLELRARTLHGLDTRDPELLERLRATWARETSKVPAEDLGETPVPFEALREGLPEVVRTTKVVIDNYRSTDRLDYESGPVTAIAVGGNTLSRGLTLEGLVSSLFVRAVSAYDTLLQMGRWFGYRNHYADLPRIWMTDELKDWFSHLATVEAEMRQDINRYMNPGVTPLNFAVRLRTHPKMSITAKAKMTSAVRATAAYGGMLVESRFFDISAEGKPLLEQNAEAARDLVALAVRDGIRTRSRAGTELFTDVPHDDVLRFLSTYTFHERSTDADSGRIAEYIRRRVRAGALGRWSVGVIGNSQATDTKTCRLGDDVEVRMVRRSRMPHEGDGEFDGVADIKTLSSRRDEALDLDVPTASGMSRKELLDLRMVERPTEGLVLLYPIEPRSAPQAKRRTALDAPTDDVVIGVALVFPEPKDKDSDVEYMSADLSQVDVEQEDLSVLDEDDE